jgi:hypothetical protein
MASTSSTSVPLADTTQCHALRFTVLESLVSDLQFGTDRNSWLIYPTEALEGFTESLNKELLPSWNIKASIIEPGGFDTQIWGDGLRYHPQPPAYSAPDTPTSLWRAAFKNSGKNATGDPERAAAALIKLSHVPANELPTRVQFGSDCWAIVKARAEATVRNAEEWSEISHSTNKEGVDKEAVIGFMTSFVQRTK